MNASIPPVFAQVILGSPNTWIVYCRECNQEFSDPALTSEELVGPIKLHKQTHEAENPSED